MKRLFRAEVRFIVETLGFRIVCTVIMIIVLASVFSLAHAHLHGIDHPIGGSRYFLFYLAIRDNDYIFPLACSLAVGASFAIDRTTRVAQYILTRGLHKWQYLLAKAAAMMLCSMLLIVLVQGVTWIASSALARYPTVQSFEVAGRANSSDDLLLHRTPMLYILLVALLRMLVAGAVATIPLLVAALGGNGWVSVISTPALWLLTEYAFNGNALVFLYPGFRTWMLWWDPSLFQKPVMCPPFLQSSFVYWALILFFNVALAAFVYLRQEDV